MAHSVMSPAELAALGGGEVAYVKILSPEQAEVMFPDVEAMPKGIHIYLLAAADGSPIALTDTMQAAIGHAVSGELTVKAVH